MTNRRIIASDMRRVLKYLDSVKELTDLLRRTHFEVPYRTVYDAVGAEASIRDILLNACVVDTDVEPVQEGRVE